MYLYIPSLRSRGKDPANPVLPPPLRLQACGGSSCTLHWHHRHQIDNTLLGHSHGTMPASQPESKPAPQHVYTCKAGVTHPLSFFLLSCQNAIDVSLGLFQGFSGSRYLQTPIWLPGQVEVRVNRARSRTSTSCARLARLGITWDSERLRAALYYLVPIPPSPKQAPTIKFAHATRKRRQTPLQTKSPELKAEVPALDCSVSTLEGRNTFDCSGTRPQQPCARKKQDPYMCVNRQPYLAPGCP
ncbi:hypothetical protein B0T19DRAFT_137026 [Cercophora scortea]|uniref:Uncharacterized protein n=1 Tax=Cercophora scortea TaxID=314031 RepID=A0AAE0J097_9PEZI|nr:hypothetical protein B0T19DRAFT_137026 [Cercophora scortea]